MLLESAVAVTRVFHVGAPLQTKFFVRTQIFFSILKLVDSLGNNNVYECDKRIIIRVDLLECRSRNRSSAKKITESDVM